MRAAPGSGLGLAIARSLVELHGGRLRIKSRLGAGTVVALSLPRQAVMAAASAARLPGPGYVTAEAA